MTQAPANGLDEPADGGDRSPRDDILVIDGLARRWSEAADHAAKADGLGALAETLATNPRGLLQHVVETAMALCRAGLRGGERP